MSKSELEEQKTALSRDDNWWKDGGMSEIERKTEKRSELARNASAVFGDTVDSLF
jgi:hypothetical protein